MIDRSWPPGSADVPVGSHSREALWCRPQTSGQAPQHAKSYFEVVVPEAMWLRTFGAGVPAGEGPGRKPDAPGGHQARSEVRSTASRAAVRGLEPRTRSEVRCGWGLAV